MNILDYMLFGILFLGFFITYIWCVYLNYRKEIHYEWHDCKCYPLPYGEEVICYNERWINFESNPYGIKMGVLSKGGFTSSYWDIDKNKYIIKVDNSLKEMPRYWKAIPHVTIYK